MNRTSQSAEGFFRRSMRASIAMGALVMLFASIYAGPSAPTVALIYAASLVWMLLNFLLWRFGIREMLGAKRLVFLIPLVAAKFGWLVFLYFLCSWLGVGKKIEFSVFFLLGLNTPFLVMSLKALGAVLTGEPKSHLPHPEIQDSKTPENTHSTAE